MELGTRKLLYNLTHRGPLNAWERQTATDSELSGGSFCRMIQKKKNLKERESAREREVFACLHDGKASQTRSQKAEM